MTTVNPGASPRQGVVEAALVLLGADGPDPDGPTAGVPVRWHTVLRSQSVCKSSP